MTMLAEVRRPGRFERFTEKGRARCLVGSHRDLSVAPLSSNLWSGLSGETKPKSEQKRKRPSVAESGRVYIVCVALSPDTAPAR
jgi:hypothetical protein